MSTVLSELIAVEASVHTIFLRTGRGPGKQLVNAMRILGLNLPSNLVSHGYLSSVLLGSDTRLGPRGFAACYSARRVTRPGSSRFFLPCEDSVLRHGSEVR